MSRVWVYPWVSRGFSHGYRYRYKIIDLSKTRTCTHYSNVHKCKDPNHFLFSGFVYCYLHNPFLSYTVNILNVSYYLTIERDLVQVSLMSKDQVLNKPIFPEGK